jgi:hypothetical protein
VVCAVLFTAPAPGQTTGSISGRVTDSSGSPLSGVRIEAVSDRLQGRRTSATSRDGLYHLAALPPGDYVLRAALPSFRAAEKSVPVSVGTNATADFVLTLGAEERVLVTDEPLLIDATSTATGARYSSQVMAHLPLDRNYADVVRSSPGVVPDSGPLQGRALALSIYGATSLEHQWFIDGVNTTGINRGAQSKAINNEFVQEIDVKTGGYQPEYGRALGGIISVVTKSGGNAFHGEGFVYFDSGALEAEQRFIDGVDSSDAGMRLADHRRTDYGFSLGGYVLKDRLWFFLAYDRVDFPASVSRFVSSATVPSSMRFPLDGTDSLYSGKLTWNAGNGTTLAATVFYDPTTNSGAGASDPRQGGAIVEPITSPEPGTWESERTIGAADYGLRASQLLGSAGLVTLQGAHHEERYTLTPTGPGLQPRLDDLTCEDGTPVEPCGQPGEPNFSEGGFGFVYGPDQNNHSRGNQARGDATFFLAAHELKAGGDYVDGWTHAVSYSSGGQYIVRANEFGQTYYQHTFFAPSQDDLTSIPLVSQGGLREYGAFVQDTWRPSSCWSVNAGVRFDRDVILTSENRAALRTTVWQPRLGVAWDPGGDGRTRVYASAGRFSYGLPTDLALRSFGPVGFVTTFNFSPTALEQDPGVLNHEKPITRLFSLQVPVDSGLEGVSQDELTIGIERALGPSLSIGLKGTYRRLAHAIEDRADLDYTAAGNGGSSFAITNPGSSSQFASGRFTSCDGFDDGLCGLEGAAPLPPARRLYRGVELSARKTAGSSWIQASYVFSSLRGNYDGETTKGNFGYVNPGTSNAFDFAALTHNGYGRLLLDRPHQLRVDGYSTLAFGLSVGLQAWLRSGEPLDRYGYFDSGYGPAVLLLPRGLAGRLPMEWDANLTAAYPLHVGAVTVTLQGYLFNLFDNQTPIEEDTAWSYSQPKGYPGSIFDPAQKKSNDNYGKVTRRSDPRLFRAAVRVAF